MSPAVNAMSSSPLTEAMSRPDTVGRCVSRPTLWPQGDVIPVYEGLHDHPRFRDLARRMNVPILTGPEDSG